MAPNIIKKLPKHKKLERKTLPRTAKIHFQRKFAA